MANSTIARNAGGVGFVVTLSLSGNYRIEGIDRLLSQLQPLIQMEEKDDVVVDLSGLVHVSPAALALLTAVLVTSLDAGVVRSGRIIDPDSPGVRNYLMRMDLFTLASRNRAQPEPFRRRAAVGFRPCRRFVGEEYSSVARELTDALAERCMTDEIARSSIRVCLDELTENVIHHADSKSGGFGAAQGYDTARRFEIGIVDLGIGIARSLRKNAQYADVGDDVDAITASLSRGVTSTPERNAGVGLFITKLLLQDNGGMLMVRSGNGAVKVDASGETRSASEVHMPGTLVTLRAMMDKPLDINALYRRLDHDDDGDIDS